MRVLDRQDLAQTALRAIDNGATVARRSTVEWKISGNCTEPVSATLTGRPRIGGPGAPVEGRTKGGKQFTYVGRRENRHQIVSGEKNNPLWMDLEVRCRKCANCMRARARLWADRAQAEIRQSPRNWLGTLTLSPESHFIMMCRATKRLKDAGVDWSSLPEDEQRMERHKEISKEITLWAKRVRKNSKAHWRFMCVMETHKTGLPHYHLLVHEGATPVRKRVLKDAWTLGFSDFKLIEPEATASARSAWYVSKYLMKTNEARVRASVRYGTLP